MLSHRNLLGVSLAYYADIERVYPGTTMLHAAALSHGAGLYLLPHLLGGGHQVLYRRFDPVQILDAFAAYPEVSIFAVPTMVNRLTSAALEGNKGPGNLRSIVYGGAPMYVSDLLRALDVFGLRLYQLYGQGEAPMTITGLNHREHAGAQDTSHLARLATCGSPRSGIEVRVVNSLGQDVPPGEPGEIITRSDCVMSGYWNNPKATAAALRDGWLWTGDIGELDNYGRLALRDRSKDMLISGGSNIYPREIEEVLLLHPGVAKCAVVGRPHADLGEEPVAFVVRRPGTHVERQELDELCLQNIARFKRPRLYRFLDELPKSDYGKVLKTELRRLL
jgi:acyl-CoA synthetase (AMP-forming)/AMP-acid ligase II